jgi:hypothetical protein
MAHFSGESLFDRLGRAVCATGVLPRKELYESWEVARRTRRRFRGGRVVDLAAGHGLLAWAMLLLDDSSPEALCVDRCRPTSAARLAAELEARWPRLAGRVRFVERPLAGLELGPGDVVVSAHACGPLTDEVLAIAVAARARVAVLPCCQDVVRGDTGGLGGWLDGPLAVDVVRALRLRAAGYRTWTQRIPGDITPKNRLLLGEPLERDALR